MEKQANVRFPLSRSTKLGMSPDCMEVLSVGTYRSLKTQRPRLDSCGPANYALALCHAHLCLLTRYAHLGARTDSK